MLEWSSVTSKFCVHAVIVKASSGPRYVVGCRNKVDKAKLTAGTRVALDMTTLTIMRALPREVNLRGRVLQHLQSAFLIGLQCFCCTDHTGSMYSMSLKQLK